jgi:hypothetical protein
MELARPKLDLLLGTSLVLLEYLDVLEAFESLRSSPRMLPALTLSGYPPWSSVESPM